MKALLKEPLLSCQRKLASRNLLKTWMPAFAGMTKKGVLIGFLLCLPLFSFAEESFPLHETEVNSQDKASLQRGAKIYFNYCSGCHSLQYMRYNRLASDLGIVDSQGHVVESLVKKNFIFTESKVGDAVKIAMTKADAKEWFGVVPPDLSVILRARGANWLYTYLHSFYEDPKRPWGTNNGLFPAVAMPNVLEPLQGKQIPIYSENGVKVIERLALIENGTMTPHQFDETVADVVNFLAYVSEPSKQERKRLGVWVILFLIVWTGFLYLLKKEYWKGI